MFFNKKIFIPHQNFGFNLKVKRYSVFLKVFCFIKYRMHTNFSLICSLLIFLFSFIKVCKRRLRWSVLPLFKGGWTYRRRGWNFFLLLLFHGGELNLIHPVPSTGIRRTSAFHRNYYMLIFVYHRMAGRIVWKISMRSFNKISLVFGFNFSIKHSVPDGPVDVTVRVPLHHPVIVGVVKVG